MAIEAIEVPVRSRVWSDQDAASAYNLLVAGSAAKYGEYVKEDGSPDEARARTQGMALDRLIEARHGRRFGVSVWVNEEGKAIGALLPREPKQRKPKGKSK